MQGDDYPQRPESQSTHPQTVQAYPIPPSVQIRYQQPRVGNPALPYRRLFVLGAIGHFFVAGASIAYGMVLFTNLSYYSYSYSSEWMLANLVAGVLFTVALVIQLFGFLAMGKTWRSAMGYATFGFGLVTAGLLISTIILLSFSQTGECYYGYCHDHLADWAKLVYYLGLTILGILLILQGTTYIESGKRLKNPGPATAAGVLSIVGGALCCTFFLSFIGLFLFAPAAIVGGITLLLSLAPRNAANGMKEYQMSETWPPRNRSIERSERVHPSKT